MAEIATCLRTDEIRTACAPQQTTYVFGLAPYPKALRGDYDDAQQEITLWTSADALGIAAMPALHRAICDGIEFHGAGDDSALPGLHPVRLVAEQTLAAWHNQPAACVLQGAGMDRVLAALVAGLGGCNIIASHVAPTQTGFDPANPETLTQALAEADPSRPTLIVLDSIGRNDGAIAPLARICSIAKDHGARVILDDSNGVGALGAEGAGLSDAGVALVYSAGSLGLPVAYVAGQADLVAMVSGHLAGERALAVPLFLLDAVPRAVALIQRQDEARAKLRGVANDLCAALTYIGLPVADAASHIVCVHVRNLRQTRLAASLLRDHYGIAVTAVETAGHEHLRITCGTHHTADDIEALSLGLETIAIEMGWRA
ncbi:aminotransferase class I/II-fold pyridoxal phosphate-dependent enzyme [Donghicola tyrosinivorans]|uniref:7-keto-8-aminopelargonate synthetase-like enzyme n=1 Tax=Donghicola tyrosinivorans TaxID=1652492 RepID=A0A2T0WEB3_9RHOB|nr:aminotransferase class I/II-fold pyridoxal phosphate-dependent enzyme [Donghicola tyrosinivorans]PRY85049.1 7-keto-8-aminopelargonate synthetase-like enzyme [Donghicola tyrosinivorans]